jgi:hypothetical protein
MGWLDAWLCFIQAAACEGGGILFILLLALLGAASSAARTPPLRDPVLIRIGILCRWERSCIRKQQAAMVSALSYVERKSPPRRRIHMCNRNASRASDRLDWVGFYNCIRNMDVGR